MSKDPAILFYTGDFLNGCTDLTFEERGQYITLLCLQHQKGHLSDKTIKLMVGAISSDVLKKFKKDSDGLYFNERMEEEIIKRTQHCDRQRERIQAYWDKIKSGDTKTDTTEDTTVLPYENEDEDENRIDYESIVNLYHDLCPKMRKVFAINDQRKGFINARIAEYGINKVTEVLRKAGESEFLNGTNTNVWKADFEWLMRPQNFLKVLEGKYDNKIVQKQVAM